MKCYRIYSVLVWNISISLFLIVISTSETSADNFVFDTWAEQVFKKCGKGFPPHLCRIADAFSGRELLISAKQLRYQPRAAKIQPRTIANLHFENNGSAPATQTFSNSKTTQSSFSWTMQRGISITNSRSNTLSNSSSSSQTKSKNSTFNVGISAKIPFIGGGVTASKGTTRGSSNTYTLGKSDQRSITRSFNISVSNSNTQTRSVSNTWTWNATITIPPRTRVQVSLIVNEVVYDVPFKLNVVMEGRVVMWMAKPRSWWDSGKGVGDFVQFGEFYVPSPLVPARADRVLLKQTGVFKGIHGISSYVRIDEEKL